MQMKTRFQTHQESDGCPDESDDEVEESDLFEDIAGSIDVDGDSYPLPEPAEHPTHCLHSILMWALYFLIV